MGGVFQPGWAPRLWSPSRLQHQGMLLEQKAAGNYPSSPQSCGDLGQPRWGGLGELGPPLYLAKWGNHSFPSSRFLKEWFCPRSHIIHISHLAVSSRQAGPAQCPMSSSPAPNLELALPRSLCFYQSGVKRVRLMLCSTKICSFGLAWTIHSFWVRGQKNGFLKI